MVWLVCEGVDIVVLDICVLVFGSVIYLLVMFEDFGEIVCVVEVEGCKVFVCEVDICDDVELWWLVVDGVE